MIELTELADLRMARRTWGERGEALALVPTMGALHAGHLRLVTAAKAHAARVMVSIFVNPAQFGANEDFARYPRPLERDLELLRAAGADAVWLPSASMMYPEDFTTQVRVGEVTERWEGAIRPGHFEGVATVVAKLLNQVTPEVALFGEKDYQQLCLIKRLVNNLNMNINVIGVGTERDVDGLALSSRNQYLSAEQRAIAPVLYATLTTLADALQVTSGATVDALLEEGAKTLLAAGFDAIDYLALCDGQSLAPLKALQPDSRLLVAARLGTTRLIDNIRVG